MKTMMKRAAAFLVLHGPATAQERWEENSGYSPSTLAANIAALHCAAMMAEERGDLAVAQYLHDYADFLESHVERWTVTTQGTLVPGISRHYIRILPVDLVNPEASPLSQTDFTELPPAVIVTAGFDPLRDEGRAYAEKLQAAGVRARLVEFPAQIHDFLRRAHLFEKAREAFPKIAQALREVAET